mgnify:CR=1 FL=1
MNFELDNNFVFWLSRLNNLMQEEFNKDLLEYEVTWPQWLILNSLHHKKLDTPSELAKYLGIDRSAITRLADRLEKKSLLTRTRNKLDRRNVTLQLSDRGRVLISGIDSRAQEHQQRYLDALHSTESRALKAFIQKMLRVNGVEALSSWKHI